MMWGIARSAEAMFSRFAMRRVLKFVLKKKLGRFLLGDIDLDQLDVQLSEGTVRLKDLALNVDHINDKLGKSAMFKVREGSIGSLLVKVPWNCKDCLVEVDELELVLMPSGGDTFCCDNERCDSIKDDPISNQLEKDDVAFMSTTSSIDVHEGVQVIAEMVKWLLASFHVKIKNIIVALDPLFQRHDMIEESLRNAVFRITEVECGTSFSGSDDKSNGGDFLGIDMLTIFLTFRGAVLELLLVDDTENQMLGPCSECLKTTPVLMGGNDGVSGSIRLSIPWKNGSLDIRRMDVDVSLDPVEVEIQPWTLKWFLMLSKKLEGYEKIDRTLDMSAGISQSGSGYHFRSSASYPFAIVEDKSIHNRYRLRRDIHNDDIMENSPLISDWLPGAVGKSRNDTVDVDELGASVEQFFECFDGMRNSQSMLGSSGMWNLTCSFISAISAASNIASGSLCIPAEQQHAETNVKITLAEVSVVLSFLDEDDMAMQGASSDDSKLHYLISRWQDVHVVVQVNLKDCRIGAIVKHIDLSDYFSGESNVSDAESDDFNGSVNTQSSFIKRLQADVCSALPSSSFYTLPEDPFSFLLTECCENRLRCEQKDIVKARLFETYGSTHLQYAVNWRSSGWSSTGSASFSIEMPPFIFWANLNLLEKLLDFLKKTRTCFGINNAEGSGLSDEIRRQHETSARGDVTGTLHGNIFLPTARMIVCFPSKKGESYGCYALWDQFIGVDFSSMSDLKMENARCASDALKSSRNKYSASASHSLSLHIDKVDIYLVSVELEDHATGIANDLEYRRFSTDRVLSLSSTANHSSVISLLWHGHAVTGAWIVKNAKLLATSDDLGSKTRMAMTGYEFSYATSRRDTEDLNSQMRREMVLSSDLLLWVSLRHVEVVLGNSQFIRFCHLLNEAMSILASGDKDSEYERNDTPVSQLSVLVGCDSIEVNLELDVVDCTESPLQRELPGSWHKFKLNVQSFEWLSVSSLGGVRGASFLWISHGEGRLTGTITGLPDEELLLVSCSNSLMGRGDGEGSNLLSCKPAGSDIVHLFDPESLDSFMSITVKCSTIVAPGARLDWLDKIFSFFSLPPSNSEEATESNLPKDTSRDNTPGRSSLVFTLRDGGLSYEPRLCKSTVCGKSSTQFCCDGMEKNDCESLVACLLAASSLKLSSTTADGTSERHYDIRIQDLGLLLHVVSMVEKTSYSVEHLRKIGYVKVAMESLVEAVLRTNCGNDLHWELDCSQSHITINTCHDTTLGLIRLFSQIQEFFAPDLEEMALHLQNRWNDVQQVQERKSNGESKATSSISSSDSAMKQVSSSASSDPGIGGLMDDICEDAFGDNCGEPLAGCEAEVTISLHGRQEVEGLTYDSNYPEMIPVVISQSFHATGLKCQTAESLQEAELIDSYCLSELRSLSELIRSNQFPDGMSKSRSLKMEYQDVCRQASGWYGNTPLELMEEHIAVTNGLIILKQLGDTNNPFGNPAKSNESDRLKGRALLSNFTIKWRMYAGSDWKELDGTARRSAGNFGRDGSAYLELLLSDMNVQYDAFPDGGIHLSRIRLSVKDFHLHDRSKSAPWKVVLGYYHSKEHPRKSSSNAFKIDLEAVRPNPSTPLEEYRLRIAVLPLSLHLHQSQLDFLTAFFLGNSSPVGVSDQSNVMPTMYTDLGSLPVIQEALLPFFQASSRVFCCTLDSLDHTLTASCCDSWCSVKLESSGTKSLFVLFQKFDLWPLTIRVDYQPTRVDLAALSRGKFVELVNLVPWKGVELELKPVQATGLYGWQGISEIIVGEWLEDISHNQIHKLLRGLPTIQSLVSVGSGATKLVTLPVKSYRKNNKLVKGVQRGTVAFLRSISVEALGLGVNLAAGAHDILLHAENIVSSIQPSANENLSEGLGRSASALVHTPIKTYQRSGSTAAIASAIRGAPAAAIAPASATAKAVHCVLRGVRNSLDREHESMRK
ncbi:Autophagy-related protein [Drosera capensis]